MFDDVTKNPDGTISWDIQENDIYHITGVNTRGDRFKVIITSNPRHMSGINLWRGNKWLVRNGKRKLLSSTWN